MIHAFIEVGIRGSYHTSGIFPLLPSMPIKIWRITFYWRSGYLYWGWVLRSLICYQGDPLDLEFVFMTGWRVRANITIYLVILKMQIKGILDFTGTAFEMGYSGLKPVTSEAEMISHLCSACSAIWAHPLPFLEAGLPFPSAPVSSGSPGAVGLSLPASACLHPACLA